MFVYIFALLTFVNAELRIYPEHFANFTPGYLSWPPDQKLKLTCELLGNQFIDQYTLVWYLPHSQGRHTNITLQNGKTSLVMDSISSLDNGPYTCKAEKKVDDVPNVKPKTVTLTVGSSTCDSGWFQCHSNDNICIKSRYKCDGYEDCPDGSDETIDQCGQNWCEGKLRCGEKARCLDPSHCCDPELDSTCAVLLDCCRPYIESNRYYYQLGIEQSGKFHRNKSNSHLVAVIGCAVAFTCVFCVVIILMCQFPTEKPWLRPPNFLGRDRGWPRGSAGQPHSLPVTMEDLDVYFESLRNVSSCQARNEADLQPNLPMPPPYILAAEPPPPYPESPEPLAVEVENNNEDNNNGDINGNSDLRDQHTERVVAVLRPISPRMANRRMLRGGSSLVALNQASSSHGHMRESRSYAALVSPTRFTSHQQRLMLHQDSETDSDD